MHKCGWQKVHSVFDFVNLICVKLFLAVRISIQIYRLELSVRENGCIILSYMEQRFVIRSHHCFIAGMDARPLIIIKLHLKDTAPKDL